MIVLSGAGWILNAQYGVLKKGESSGFDNIKSLYSKLQLEGIFSYPVKNFGRFNSISKMTCCLTALSLHDCGIRYSPGHKTSMGIIATNTTGCLYPMIDYFKDYFNAGRKMGRGNLFISVLPSSAISEASIHFGCQGPTLYIGTPEKHIPVMLRTAADMVTENNNKGMLCVYTEETQGACFILQDRKNIRPETALQLDNIIRVMEKSLTLAKIIHNIQTLF